MSRMKLFLDMDRTLLNTGLFDELRLDIVREHYPEIDVFSERLRQQEFYVRDGEMYYYDFTEHMNSLGLPATIVYKALRGSILSDGRLEYEGVKKLVEWAKAHTELKILTYGKDDYQQLKASLCPSIEGVELVIVQRTKDEFFHEMQLEGEVWMVDDKPIHGLPENVNFIQVSLDGADFAPGAKWPQVKNLDEVLKILQKM